MKKLYIIGGPMGVGKTTVCKALMQKLDKSVFLDGDWCWNMRPFQVTQETKLMVIDNICHMLNNFIKCSAFENIIFCWVMHQRTIIDTIISNLKISDCDIIKISMICNPHALRKRLQKDINNGIRTNDIIEKSINYIPLYKKLDTIKIDVSDKMIKDIITEILIL